ncbi:YjbH domain-containing protein, partial [Candidatus Riflebacteria bacterium]
MKEPKVFFCIIYFSLFSVMYGSTLYANVNFKGLTGYIFTPNATVSTALSYQNINDISQTLVLKPFFANVFEGSYLRRLNGDKKSQYNVKMRLVEEGVFLPALAAGFYDLNENISKRQGFLVATKKVPGFDFSFSAGLMRDTEKNKNDYFVG